MNTRKILLTLAIPISTKPPFSIPDKKKFPPIESWLDSESENATNQFARFMNELIIDSQTEKNKIESQNLLENLTEICNKKHITYPELTVLHNFLVKMEKAIYEPMLGMEKKFNDPGLNEFRNKIPSLKWEVFNQLEARQQEFISILTNKFRSMTHLQLLSIRKKCLDEKSSFQSNSREALENESMILAASIVLKEIDPVYLQLQEKITGEKSCSFRNGC